MPGEMLYSSARAAKLAGVSEASLRNYTAGGRFGKYYQELFSAGAAPGPGQPRQFTAGDIALLKYIRQRTAAGVPHARIADEVTAGALESFDWQPPEETASQARAARNAGQEEPPTAALVAVQEVARQIAGVLTAQLNQTRADNEELRAQLMEARERAARAEAEARELRAQLAESRRGLLARFFRRGQ